MQQSRPSASEVRIRYRQKRRRIVSDVILQQLINEELKKYVYAQATTCVPESIRLDFIEDVLEDLDQIDESRLAGLGITLDELTNWKKRKNRPE